MDFNAHIRNLCPEVRMNIFSGCLFRPLPIKPMFGHHPTTPPALLAALRPDSKLYEEALETHYKINYFTYHTRKPQTLLHLKDDCVMQLRKLTIPAIDFFKESITVNPKILVAQNLEYLRICVQVTDDIFLDPVVAVLASVKQFTRLKTLVLYISANANRAQTLLDVNTTDELGQNIRATVSLVEKEMGVKMEELGPHFDRTVTYAYRTFVWKAEKKGVDF